MKSVILMLHVDPLVQFDDFAAIFCHCHDEKALGDV